MAILVQKAEIHISRLLCSPNIKKISFSVFQLENRHHRLGMMST